LNFTFKSKSEAYVNYIDGKVKLRSENRHIGRYVQVRSQSNSVVQPYRES